MTEQWKALVTENPMLIEIVRFRRKFFTFSGSNVLNSAMLGLLLMCYAGLVMLVFNGRGSIPPIGIVLFQTSVFILVAPATMYGAIAGEREKRTWDLLIAAPVTKAQIVIGKFISGFVAVTVGYGLVGLPILISAITYDKPSWPYLVLAELSSYTFVLFLVALTLFFSARSRRGFMALGLVLAAMAIALLAVPILASVIISATSDQSLANSFNPFLSQTALLEAADRGSFSSGSNNPVLWSITQIAGYVVLTTVFLLWASRTLHYAENDVKFLSGNPHA